MIKIGIDCHKLEDKTGAERAGIGRHTYKLLEAISHRPELKKEYKFYLYFKKEAPASISFLENEIFVKRVAKLPFFFPFFRPSFNIFFHIALPIYVLKDRVNVTFFPSFMLPALFMSKAVVVLTNDIYWEFTKGTLPLRYRLGYRLFANWAAYRATQITTQTNASRDEISGYFNIPKDKIAVVPLGADLKQFAPKNTVKKENYILYVGQAFPRRHLAETIMAFEKIAPEFKELKLMAVGVDKYNPPKVDILKTEVNKRLGREQVERREFVDDEDLVGLYQKARLFIYVSSSEAMGLPPLEALAAGTAPVVADTATTREIFEDRAFFVASGAGEYTSDEIAKTILTGLRDDSKRKYIEEGREQILKKYTWEKHADLMLELFNKTGRKMMNKLFTTLNIVFLAGFGTTILIIFGYLPRQAVFAVLALYIIYIVFSKTKNGVNLFLRSIPFFIAMPITQGFDNFDMGRLILFVLFIKWLAVDSDWIKELKVWRGKEHILYYIEHRKMELLGLGFFAFAFLSLFVAFFPEPGIKQMIFIANAVFLFIIIRGLIIKEKGTAMEFVRNFAYSGLLAVLFGYLQFFAAYFSQAYIFHYWWGQLISLNMYGRQWADIVTDQGNTWFSYSGDTLRLRMFSTFPDSHSFPMYVIMTLPAMFVSFFSIFKNGISKFPNVRYGIRIIIICSVIFALINLALVLSGTRGIWLASLSTLFVLGMFKILKIDRRFSKLVLVSFLVFLLSFPLYFVIVSFPQFRETEFTSAASLSRLRSIIDLSELSNQGRISIWKETLISIADKPLTGVGLGNYPQVLGEPMSASDAGASAHNLYLHIASTIGIPGLLVFLWMVWEVLIMSADYIKRNSKDIWAVYFAMLIFATFWLGAYLMTDAALFDGRALLGFMALLSIGVGLYREKYELSASEI